MSTPKKPLDPVPPSDPAEAQAWLRTLVEQAEKGDETILPIVRNFLAFPAVVELHGNLAVLVEKTLVRAATEKNLFFREALTRKLELLRAELAGPTPTPIERLLAEHATMCWLWMQCDEARYAQAEKRSLTLDEFYQRKLDRAHKRYLAAIKTLALVRKMAVPVLRAEMARPSIRLAACAPAEG